MDGIYPAGPESVSPDLTKATRAYHRGVRLAFSALLLFLTLYTSLTAWFGWWTYQLVIDATAGGSESFLGYAIAVPASLITFFLIKALFFVRRGTESKDIEITAEDEPKLFEFLNKLADDARAPRPHRVFLSPRVNAAVFYNLTLFNLFFPSRKNLEIGLGLVNALNLGELKAVLAHEFGHFAQGSMAVGHWVYIAQQIASHLIYHRDRFDSFLVGLSRIDLRIAWIGWLLQLLVWALRSLLDGVFSLVIFAQRSLSREMEFNADLVAVSLTGSDALIHALHRLGAADEAWDRALSIAHEDVGEQRAIEDIFVVHKIVAMNFKRILNDEFYDQPPPLPATNKADHRVFGEQLAHPPRMWSTHPPNRDREDNAKREYIEAPLDERPAWTVFGDSNAVRKVMTRHIVAAMSDNVDELLTVPIVDTVKSIEARYASAPLASRYRGLYLNRSAVRESARASELYEGTDSIEGLDLSSDALYPAALVDDLEAERELNEELELMSSIKDGRLKTSDGVIRHRGTIVKRRELTGVVEELKAECEAARQRIAQHDRRIRGVHQALATKVGDGWDSAHNGLVELLHYADHVEADLLDAFGHLTNVYAVVTADNRVTSRERKRLVKAANAVYVAIEGVYAEREAVRLGPIVAERLGVDSWSALLPPVLELAPPDKNNIGDLLSVIDSWVDAIAGALGAVRQVSLERLLETEAALEACVRDGKTIGDAPVPAKVPTEYATLPPGSERERQTRLGLWDRFATADGLFAGTLRTVVASTIIGAVIGVGLLTGESSITVHNGLRRAVTVEIDSTTTRIEALANTKIDHAASEALVITTRTIDGALVETFAADASNSLIDYVYNIANAAPLVEGTANYGSAAERPDRLLGTQRWSQSAVDYLFRDPPESVETKSDGATRDFLYSYAEASPEQMLSALPENADPMPLINAHARWDGANSKDILTWVSLAARGEQLAQIIQARLAADPNEVLSRRLEQQIAIDDEAYAAVCEQHGARAATVPEDQNWQYLVARCITDQTARDAAFIDGYRQTPAHPWFALAAGLTLAEQAKWEEAAIALQTGYKAVPAMRAQIADTLARVLRALEINDADTYARLGASSDYLRFVLAIEGAEELPDALAAYAQLHAGDIEGAAATASSGEQAYLNIVRYAAASDGASDALQARAAELGVGDGIDQDSVWTAIATALRAEQDVSVLNAKLQEVVNDDVTPMVRFVEKIGAGEIDGADEELDAINPRLRGQAYAMATILLQDQTPPNWRLLAKQLLFSAERPQFN